MASLGPSTRTQIVKNYNGRVREHKTLDSTETVHLLIHFSSEAVGIEIITDLNIESNSEHDSREDMILSKKNEFHRMIKIFACIKSYHIY